MLTFLKKNRKISAFSFCCFFYIQQPDISEMSGLFLSSSMYDLDTTKEGCTYSTPSVHPLSACVLIIHGSSQIWISRHSRQLTYELLIADFIQFERMVNMPLINIHALTRTVILMDKFQDGTGNRYKVVSARPYSDKKGVLPDGYVLTLKVLTDTIDYGFDKDGNPRENNEDQNFDVTVLAKHTPLKKGDYIALKDFDADHSYAIGFDLILRFRNYEKLSANEHKGSTK